MITNEVVKLPITFRMNSENSYETVSYLPRKRPFIDKYIFDRFLNGKAAYLCNDPRELTALTEMIRYTNISVFNVNFVDDTICGICNTHPNKEFVEWVSGTTQDFVIVTYIVSMNTPGNYNVNAEFVRSVSEIFGPDECATIRRLDYTLIPRNYHSLSTELPWAVSSVLLTSNNDPSIISVAIGNTDDGTPAPEFNDDEKLDRWFHIQKFAKSTVGARFPGMFISAHREYIRNLKNLTRSMFDWINDIATFPEINEDRDAVAKIAAITNWVCDPKTNQLMLHVSDAHIMEQLQMILRFGHIDTSVMDGKVGYVYADFDGAIQVSKSVISGYNVLNSCHSAIQIIHEIISEHIVKLGVTTNLMAICKYPFTDNVPSIFWDGWKYNE